VLRGVLQHVLNNYKRMDYPRCRRRGLPITSSPVESLIKQLARRMKGAEKFWNESAAEAVLRVRAGLLSQDGRVERWWNEPRFARKLRIQAAAGPCKPPYAPGPPISSAEDLRYASQPA
jgi:hypothetical protein